MLEVRDEEKAFDGISIDVICVHPNNAFDPIDVIAPIDTVFILSYFAYHGAPLDEYGYITSFPVNESVLST